MTGVPWTLGYDLERGNVVTLTPPWDSVAAKHRVLQADVDRQSELSELSLIEVT